MSKPPYTEEFIRSVVKHALESDQSVSASARELGVNVNTLHGWISKSNSKNKTDNNPLYEELKRVKSENVQLKREHAILKKAAAYFAREAL